MGIDWLGFGGVWIDCLDVLIVRDDMVVDCNDVMIDIGEGC